METARQTRAGFAEFVVLIALIISLVALSIDAMLPALPVMADDLGVTRINDSQYVITIFFLGMGLGQVLFGPWSDAVGRKPAILAGFALFAAGCVLSIVASNFETMLFGRFLQGLGAAGPRIVSVALVRDRYQGREMARVMSFVMTIFILVPVFAPALGQLLMWLAGWRSIFGLFLALALALSLWFGWRQAETLPAAARLRFAPARLLLDIRAILRIRTATGYTLTMGFSFGAFLGYLGSSQPIFQVLYALGEWFPFYFGLLACAIGCASLVNARLVMRFGTRRLVRLALNMVWSLSLPALGVAWFFAGQPPLWMLMIYLLAVFFFFGILFGNLNALAMEPLGHIAGLGSAVIGSLSTLISVFFGILVADAYKQTVVPLVIGFALLGGAARLVMAWTESGLEQTAG